MRPIASPQGRPSSLSSMGAGAPVAEATTNRPICAGGKTRPQAVQVGLNSKKTAPMPAAEFAPCGDSVEVRKSRTSSDKQEGKVTRGCEGNIPTIFFPAKVTRGQTKFFTSPEFAGADSGWKSLGTLVMCSRFVQVGHQTQRYYLLDCDRILRVVLGTSLLSSWTAFLSCLDLRLPRMYKPNGSEGRAT